MTRLLQHRGAVLRLFCDPVPSECARLLTLGARDWKRLLHWLDTSGLALYFFDRMKQLRLAASLPAFAATRLETNQADNTLRIGGLIEEWAAIHESFQAAGLLHATMKGFSLWPHSVPRLELRSQLDLDFLISESCAPEARRILERRGYRLFAISGYTWEFKTAHCPPSSLRRLYAALPNRCVELHLQPSRSASSLLDRIEMRKICGISAPVLSDADQLVGQGLHLRKHMSSEFLRAAHLVEFRRHIASRFHDAGFWRNVRELAAKSPNAAGALGMAMELAAEAIGTCAPNALSEWTAGRVSREARLWISVYGRRAALAGFPGSKLYLLLHGQTANECLPAGRSVARALLPLRLPPRIVSRGDEEGIGERIGRLRAQMSFVFLRLRFHIVEGLRYAWELRRWQAARNRLAR